MAVVWAESGQNFATGRGVAVAETSRASAETKWWPLGKAD